MPLVQLTAVAALQRSYVFFFYLLYMLVTHSLECSQPTLIPMTSAATWVYDRQTSQHGL